MRKIFAVICILSTALLFNVNTKAVTTSAQSAIVINADTLCVIYQQNAMEILPMASTTKIMTGLLLAEQNTPDKMVRVTKEMVTVEGSSMGLQAGDMVTYNDLLYGLMLASGNDAANTVAISIGGSIKGFADLMNKKSAQIGLKNTNFVTPSGLDDKNHYTTAYDLAVLTAYALKNEAFKKAVSCESATLSYGNPPFRRTLTNHNKLLKLYDNAIGVKTGFTKRSGRCLVSAAKRGNITLIAVTLNDKNDWEDHIGLLDFGFENSVDQKFTPDIPDSIGILGSKDKIKLKVDEFNCGLSMGEELEYSVFLPEFVFAPVDNGEKIGYVKIFVNGRELKRLYITTNSSFKYTNQNDSFLNNIIIQFLGLIRRF